MSISRFRAQAAAIAEIKSQLPQLAEDVASAKLTADKIDRAIAVLGPLEANLRAGRPLPETLKLRDLQIVDEHGGTRIRLYADASGSQIWLADGREKRILLTAWDSIDGDVGDIRGIVVQKDGGKPVCEAPSSR